MGCSFLEAKAGPEFLLSSGGISFRLARKPPDTPFLIEVDTQLSHHCSYYDVVLVL